MVLLLIEREGGEENAEGIGRGREKREGGTGDCLLFI